MHVARRFRLTHSSRALATALLLFAPTGCTQHGAEAEPEVPDDMEPRTIEATVRPPVPEGTAVRNPFGPVPRRCTPDDSPQAVELAAGQGEGRSTLRVLTDDGLREIPLQESTFETVVVGTVAQTEVTQVFANPFDEPIEALYTFPLDDAAAVDAYRITIGKRTIDGEIKLRAEAKRDYEAAKNAGRSAALLEQERTNVFTQSIANIMPGEAIAVQMHVVQPLDQEDGRYTLVLPTVVGERYIGGKALAAHRQSGAGVARDTDRVPDASRITPPRLAGANKACSPVAITVDVETGFGLTDVASKHHRIDLTEANGVSTVELTRGVAVPNRDFVLSWDIERQSPEGSLLMQPNAEGDGGYFTLTLEPPDALRPDAAVPRDLIFVVDNSGSMSGQPIEVAKQTVKTALGSLNPNDTFQIMRFSETASALSDVPLKNTGPNRSRGLAYIDDMRGMGGTQMIQGIRAALGGTQQRGRMPVVLFLTDGYIGSEVEVFRAVSEGIGANRIFSVGVGSAPNRMLLDGLAMTGRGSATYVSIDEDPGPAVDAFYEKIARPALSDVEFDWGGLTVDDVVPSRVPDLFVGQPVVVYGRYSGTPSGEIRVKGRLGYTDVVLPVAVDFAKARVEPGNALASMWARTRIEELLRAPEVYTLEEEAIDARVEESTRLALKYSVLTEQTAFVAVDSKQVINPDGSSRVEVVEVEDVWGSLTGDEVGETHGVGGLGLVGTGRGGGGSGETTIGLGNASIIGHGGGGGTGSGYGRGAGAGFGGKGKRVPRVRQAKATVTGMIDKDMVRRIVRSHNNQVRACYTKALETDPKLAGRLAVEFSIASDGRVIAAVVQQSTLPEDATEIGECVVEAVKRWKFPRRSSSSLVNIVYPFIFAPG